MLANIVSEMESALQRMRMLANILKKYLVLEGGGGVHKIGVKRRGLKIKRRHKPM